MVDLDLDDALRQIAQADKERRERVYMVEYSRKRQKKEETALRPVFFSVS